LPRHPVSADSPTVVTALLPFTLITSGPDRRAGSSLPGLGGRETPAAPGEAPRGLQTTGDASFCTLWTYLGTPAVTLPLLQSAAGMPLGVQLVGRRDGDARLLRTARWLAVTLAGPRRRRGAKAGAGAPAARKRRVS